MPDDKAKWTRARAAAEITLEDTNRLLAPALGRNSIAAISLLAGGLSNSNFKLDLGNRHEPLVLRVYQRDVSACQKEVDIHRLVRGTVPVPEILYAQPEASENLGPFVVMRYIEGVTFRELKGTGDLDAMRQVAYSIGRTLAEIGKYSFTQSGWLTAGLGAGEQLAGPHPIPRFVEECLASPELKARTSPVLLDRVHDYAWSWATQLEALDGERSLVHCDFNSPNLMVRYVNGEWRLVAVLDWEFAIAGTPLLDIGNFMRYERAGRPRIEPNFSRGFVENGGRLPEEWKLLARVIDLMSLCEILTRRLLPAVVIDDVVKLIEATIECRDPE
jgi:aminoglycoside phosphotransferase (APT) family kinase protein